MALGIEVHAYDPTVSMDLRAKDLAGIVLHASVEEAVQNVDAIVVLTEWPEFKSLKPVNIARYVRSKNIVDARNLMDADLWRASDFAYFGVGR